MKLYVALSSFICVACISIAGCEPAPVEQSSVTDDTELSTSAETAEPEGDTASSDNPEPGEEAPARGRFTRVSDAANDFGFRLHREFEAGQNLVYSPYCIYEGLALTHLGAVGETARESSALLGASDFGHFHGEVQRLGREFRGSRSTGKARGKDRDSETPLWRQGSREELLGRRMPGINLRPRGNSTGVKIVNDLWFDRNLEPYPSFTAEAERYYGATPTLLDFRSDPKGSVETINEKVSSETEQLIPSLVDERVVDARTRFIQTTAVYLKAPWAHRFPESATKEEPFYLADDGKVTVDMMNQLRKFQYAALDDAGVKVLKLPYRTNGLFAIVLLPMGTDLASVEASLDGATFRKIVEAVEGPSTRAEFEVHVKLPKFELHGRHRLHRELESLGLETVYSPQESNLSGIADTELPLYISADIHAAHITVNERETEAAAGFGRVGGLGSTVIPKRVEFHADRPFLFFVVDRSTSAILFTARVMDPTSR